MRKKNASSDQPWYRHVKQPIVALLIETSKTFGRGLLRGVTRYVRAHRSWSIRIDERGLDDPLPYGLKRGAVDGVILRSSNETLSRAVAALKVPVVYLGERRDTGLPMLNSDDEEIVRLAVQHMKDRGFKRFGFVGFQGKPWSDTRRDFFEAEILESGDAFDQFEFKPDKQGRMSWPAQERRLCKWLSRLEKPIALMACYDVMGVRVLNACRAIELAVPEQVAVIGVDNDALLCELADPPLTSVAHDVEQIGYEAAVLMEELMTSKKPAAASMKDINPLGVVARQSTDVLAIDDTKIAEAMRFIRKNVFDGIKVSHVLEALNMNRVTLNRRFRKNFGRSPKEEIVGLQTVRCKQLLRETDFTLEKIAGLVGFEHAEYMSVLFKRETGITPGEYRRRGRKSRG